MYWTQKVIFGSRKYHHQLQRPPSQKLRTGTFYTTKANILEANVVFIRFRYHDQRKFTSRHFLIPVYCPISIQMALDFLLIEISSSKILNYFSLKSDQNFGPKSYIFLKTVTSIAWTWTSSKRTSFLKNSINRIEHIFLYSFKQLRLFVHIRRDVTMFFYRVSLNLLFNKMVINYTTKKFSQNQLYNISMLSDWSLILSESLGLVFGNIFIS